jgi:hypothetical protein
MLSLNYVAIIENVSALLIIQICYLLYYDYIYVYFKFYSIYIICYILVC